MFKTVLEAMGAKLYATVARIYEIVCQAIPGVNHKTDFSDLEINQQAAFIEVLFSSRISEMAEYIERSGSAVFQMMLYSQLSQSDLVAAILRNLVSLINKNAAPNPS